MNDDYTLKLIDFMRMRYETLAAKKEAMKTFNDRLRELDALISSCHAEILSGQGNLFDHISETETT